ncbi:MAG: hypothetical protein ACREXN_07175 [Polaromonas sp.]
MKFLQNLMRSLIATVTLLSAIPAQADADIGSVVEGQLVLGKRTFALPPGRWVVVNSSETTTSLDNGTRGAISKAQYLVLTDADNKLIAAASIRSTLASTHVATWNDATCDRKDTLFRDALDGNFSFPACLLVNHITSFWNAGVPSNEYDKKIWSWYQEKKIALPKTAIASYYLKYYAGDFVQVRYWLNPEVVGIPADTATAWNQSQWHPDLIKSSPDRVRYIDAVKSWSNTLVSANRASLYDGRPNVPSLPALPSLVK